MPRGIFDFIKKEPAYSSLQKNWHIELCRYDQFWYDLIIDPPEGFDTRAMATKYLKDLKSEVKRSLDKRFIYFVSTRKRVRLSIKKQPKYLFFRDYIDVYLEIGREKERKKIRIDMREAKKKYGTRPKVQVTDRIISFTYSPTLKVSMSVHDFLEKFSISFGFESEVKYVGYTENPFDRPISKPHLGLSRVFYKTDTQDLDTFVCYNLFKVLTVTEENSGPIMFCVANSVIDEVGVDQEGKLIEKLFIQYFNAEAQEVNKSSEMGELNNSLNDIMSNFKIKSISVHYEPDSESDYLLFGSRCVPASFSHKFTCISNNGQVEISKN